MSPEREDGIPGESENFVAPDEPKRVENPEKAQVMALASDELRTDAVVQRAEAKRIREKSAKEGNSESKADSESRKILADTTEDESFFKDSMAEIEEEKAGKQFEEEQSGGNKG